MDGEQIEISKENIQPLRQGRASQPLKEALLAQSSCNEEIQQFINCKIQEFELAVREYEGDDPLEPWYSYISWVEQYFPRHGKEGNFYTLISKCLAHFKDNEMYMQDVRYVKLWIKYLEMQPNSAEMYHMVLNHGIGTKVSDFYHSWAMDVAKTGDFKRADTIYNEGIKAKAEPKDALLQYQKNFHFMVMSNYEETTGAPQPDDEQRHVLSRLVAHGPRNSVPIERGQPLQENRLSIQPQPKAPPAPLSTAKFHLFKDENDPASESLTLPAHQPLRSFPSHEVFHSENSLAPAKWSESASNQPGHTATSQLSTPFKVHEDKEIVQSTSKKLIPSSVLNSHKAAHLNWNVPLTIFEEPDPRFVPMYPKAKVYAGGTEFSLEELRAAKYHKKRQAGISTPRTDVPTASSGVAFRPDDREKLLCSKKLLLLNESETKNQDFALDGKSTSLMQEKQAVTVSDAKQSFKEMHWEVPLHKLDTSDPRCRYMIPIDKIYCSGTEFSLEEVLAKQYQSNIIAKEDLWFENIPLAYFLPYSNNLKPMYPKEKVYCNNTEYSLEELRAKNYLKNASLAKTDPFFPPPERIEDNRVSSTHSTPSGSSRGTTPSGTPGRSFLGQSMTVNTREAMFEMKELWCSVHEQSSKPAVPNNQVASFNIFCDNKSNVLPFEIHHEETENEKKSKQNVVKTTFPNEPKVLLPSSSWSVLQDPNPQICEQSLHQGEILEQPLEKNPSLVGNVPFFNIHCDSEAVGNASQPKQEDVGEILIKPPRTLFGLISEPSKAADVEHDFPSMAMKNDFLNYDKTENASHQKQVERNQNFTGSEVQSAETYVSSTYDVPYVPPPVEDANYEEVTPCKENCAPRDYEFKPNTRVTSGILTNSPDIPVMSLEEQERLLTEEEDREQLEIEQQCALRDDITSITTAFKLPLISSTPYHETTPNAQINDMAPPKLRLSTSPKAVEPLEEEEEETGAEEMRSDEAIGGWDAQGYTVGTTPHAVRLSPILEVTGESRSSRSGNSTSSSANSRFQITYSLHGSSKTPGQMCTTSDSRFASVERPTCRLPLVEHKSTVIENELLPIVQPTVLDSPPRSEIAKFEANFAKLALQDNIDPFSSDLLEDLLASLAQPLSSRPGFQKLAEHLPSVRIGKPLVLGSKVYKLMKILGEGAYAKALKAFPECSDRPVVLKVANDDTLCWELYVSCEIQKRLADSLMAQHFVSIPNVFNFKNGSVYEMPYVSSMTLLDLVNCHLKEGTEINPSVILFMTYQVLSLIDALHKCHIIHADIKPDNFLMIPSDGEYPLTLQLIDFGRSIDMTLFPNGTEFSNVLQKVTARCIEMLTERPWTYQIDLHGAAATIHCVMFGKYMNVKQTRDVWMPTCKPKRFWENSSLFEQVYATLLNVESCNKLPDLGCVVEKLKSAVEYDKFLILDSLQAIKEKIN